MDLFYGFIPIIVMFLSDYYFINKYDYPSLSILIAICYKSQKFRWLAWNIWGNEDWFYENVNRNLRGEI
jgi:hypothetical protein